MATFRTPFRFLEAGATDSPNNVGHPLTICDADLNTVAEVFSQEDTLVAITREEAIATARLFAAAPDLLAALKETLTVAVRNEEGEFADRARVAIAAAEGPVANTA